ncbi:MAG: peptidoglycan DD-metalloendopeptidase family protein [candidate division KSB1 bacterium]|nr:peptidoglycan DD-metalloendopeptidase family protein [candidate division KSB1 bacterium]
MKLYQFYKILFVIFLLSVSGVQAQSAGSNTARQRRELQELRSEIENYEEKLAESKSKTKAAGDLIANMDREIDVAIRYVDNLKQVVQSKEQEIREQKQQIDELSEQIDELKALVKRRIVSYYKYGQRHDYELLFTSNTWRQVQVWLKYQKLIAGNDRRNYQALIEKRNELQQRREQLKQDIREREYALNQHTRETRQLKLSREKRRKYLKSLARDTTYLARHLEELQQAQTQIRQAIERNERKRRLHQKSTAGTDAAADRQQDGVAFSSLRGRLPWPVQGEIITRFGTYKHPTLNTVTENIGVEIKTSRGQPVKAVDAGQVQTITWQRGRGNIIILAHDNGYYTVYTHIESIKVNMMQHVSAEDIIGTVGESGSLKGPILHFQIWKNTENLNPETWLK